MAKERENQNTEWKEKWHDKYLEWICGMANTEGGIIYIGYNDKGEPLGLSDNEIETYLLEIPKKAKNALGVIVGVSNIDVKKDNGETVECIKIIIDKYPTPISYHGRYYARSGSNTFEVTGVELDKFMNVKLGKTWDGSPYPNVKINDLDVVAISKFRKMALKSNRLTAKDLEVSDQELLEKLQLYENGYLTCAAILLFSEEPTRYFTNPIIKIGYFGNSHADLKYQDEVAGPLITQVDRALEIIYTKYLKALIWYDGIYRKEEYIFPIEAFREILLNAVNNKEYNKGIPIQVSVYDDKIYVFNDGEFNKSIDVENIYTKKHSSYPYNPKIALAFFKSGQIESWGRGYEIIKEQCELFDVPLPIVDYQSNPGIMIEINPSKKYLELFNNNIDAPLTKEEALNNDTDGKILALIKDNNNITAEELAIKLNITIRTVKRSLKKLKDLEKIKRIGSNKTGYWIVL